MASQDLPLVRPRRLGSPALPRGLRESTPPRAHRRGPAGVRGVTQLATKELRCAWQLVPLARLLMGGWIYGWNDRWMDGWKVDLWMLELGWWVMMGLWRKEPWMYRWKGSVYKSNDDNYFIMIFVFVVSVIIVISIDSVTSITPAKVKGEVQNGTRTVCCSPHTMLDSHEVLSWWLLSRPSWVV